MEVAVIAVPVVVEMEGQGRRPERCFRPNLVLHTTLAANERLALELLNAGDYLTYHKRVEREEKPLVELTPEQRAQAREERKVRQRRESYRRKHGIPLTAPVQKSGPKRKPKDQQ
jgi:hypothetical protein